MKIDLLIREHAPVPAPGQLFTTEYNVTLTLAGCPAEFPDEEVEIETVTERSFEAGAAVADLVRKVDARIADHEACIAGLKQGREMLWAEYCRRTTEGG